MHRATHASLTLARFDSATSVELTHRPSNPETLFYQLACDTRSANTTAISNTAFVLALYGLHISEAAACEALDLPSPFAGALEQFSAVLLPVRHFGECNFLNQSNPGQIFDVGGNSQEPDEAMLVVTSAGWNENPDMERVQTFGSGVAAVRMGMTGVQGLHSQQTFFLPGGISTWDGITVTLWKNFESMRNFAYGPGLHRDLVKSHREAPNADRTSFTRFKYLHARGTWRGSDPTKW